MSLPKGHITNQNISKAPFILFQSHRDDYYNMSYDSTKGVQQETILSKMFFHPENVEFIHKMIIKKVFDDSKGKYLIEKQDDADLNVVMRSIFLQCAKHQPYNIRDQIMELNNLVVSDVVPNIISAIDAQFGYLDRTFSPLQIMDRPENTSVSGTRTLPSVTKTF